MQSEESDPGVESAAQRQPRSHCLRIRRRSSSEVPPHTPDSWLVARANSRQADWASHWWQTDLAFSICSMAGPVVPTGKNRSGSVSRQADRSRQSSFCTERVRERDEVRATMPPRNRANVRRWRADLLAAATKREAVHMPPPSKA